MAENLVLDMPFDEPDGSTIAYDHSPGAHHAAIEGGRFVPGRFNNCVYFPGVGKAEIIEQIVDFNDKYTFMVWAMAQGVPPGPTRTYVLIKFLGENNFRVIQLSTRAVVWTHITLTHNGGIFIAYVNGVPIGTALAPPGQDATGFCILNDSKHSTGGYCMLDGAKIINGAASPPDEIIDIINQQVQPVDFSVDNINFLNYGVHVQGLSGSLDKPEDKEGLVVDWPDQHGLTRAIGESKIYQAREHEMTCWLRGENSDDFISKWMDFRALIESPGYKRLTIIAGNRVMPFDVMVRRTIVLDKEKWTPGESFGRFKLVMSEDYPVKRILKVNGGSCSVTLSSSEMFVVSWGDGEATYNVRGEPVTVSHNYDQPGEYYVIVAGRLDKLSSFSTDAIIYQQQLV